MAEPMAELESMCACGSGMFYQKCCEPYHNGKLAAPTAVSLMRSRYAAFVYGRMDYLVSTTLSAKRTADMEHQYLLVYKSVRWTGLEIVGISQGGRSDQTGKVEFKASYTEGGRIKVHHEHSRFRRRGGQWYYVDAVSEG